MFLPINLCGDTPHKKSKGVAFKIKSAAFSKMCAALNINIFRFLSIDECFMLSLKHI